MKFVAARHRHGSWFLGELTSRNHVQEFSKVDGPVARVRSHLGSRAFRLYGSGPLFTCGDDGALLAGCILNAKPLQYELGIRPEQCGNYAALLMAAYRRWGIYFTQHLHGEFACVLWDASARRVLLARDPSGFYPLYYTKAGEDLLFGSNLSDLLSEAPLHVNEEHVAHWLALVPTAAGSTFFKDAYAVQPGSVLEYKSGAVRQIVSWQPDAVEMLQLRDPREYAEGLRTVLQNAVEERISAMPTCATMLSGGLDSSSITALAARSMQGRDKGLRAFTAMPSMPSGEASGRFSNESSRARSVAAMYANVEHVVVPHGRHRTFDMIDRFSTAEMQPIFNPANYEWMYEIGLRAAACGVTSLYMALAGNLTVSYNGEAALSSLLHGRHVWKALQLGYMLRRHGGYRWRGVAFHLGRPLLPSSASRWLDTVRGAPSDVQAYSLIHPQFAREVSLSQSPREMRGQDSRAVRVAGLQRLDAGPAMQGLRCLTGVSPTDATMDRRVVEFCLSVPDEIFCLGGVPRALIRNAMRGLLPEAVRTERRRGLQAADFGIHFQREIGEAIVETERLEGVALAARMLNLSAMRGMLAEAQQQTHAQSQMLFWPKLMRALSLGRFLRRVEEGTILSNAQVTACR